ncbi:MAG: hypothetical protein M3R15_05325, partial [Acidobacteriota bacterium]|nr:hypothetical protein [Acidobacteriota bacterium]
TSPHWYSAERLRALIAAYINAESNGAQPRTVREFISEFRGLSATQKQKSILQIAGLSSVYLRDLVKDGDVNRSVVDDLLMLMRGESKAVKPAALGQVGEKHLRTWFDAQGVELRTFKYKRHADTGDNNMPYVVEFAFALRGDRGTRRLLTGINWSPTLADPFRSLNRYGIGLDGLLNQLHISPDEPVTFVLHLACPHLNYTDRGKSSLEDL